MNIYIVCVLFLVLNIDKVLHVEAFVIPGISTKVIIFIWELKDILFHI